MSKSRTRIFNLSEINFSAIDEFLKTHDKEGYGYSLFWRYMIYYLTIEILIKGNMLDYKQAKAIKEVLNIKSDSDFMRRVSYLNKLDFSLSAFGFEAAVKTDLSFVKLPLFEKCHVFEEIIRRAKVKDNVNIIFDELDSQFGISDAQAFEEYEEIVKSLLVTSLEVKRRLPNVNPIVLIRDDIFDLITRGFSETNKLIDKTFYLKWSRHELIEMCEHRLMSDTSLGQMHFSDVFIDYLVISKMMRQQRQAKVKMEEYFFEHTMLRPRDVILLLREIARICLLKSANRIDATMMRIALQTYSVRFKQELIDEIHSSLPNIADIFDELSKLRASRFKSEDLMDWLTSDVAAAPEQAKRMIDILFYFSVIGVADGSVLRFRYTDERARYIPGVHVELHPGIRDAIHFVT